MAVPDWVTYLSLAGSAVGTLSGCLAYWRTGRLKALDLRLEPRRTDVSLRQQVMPMAAQLAFARQSRERVAAATGGLRSGATQHFLAELERDLVNVKAMEAALPHESDDYRATSSSELETRLVERHQLMLEARALSAKYAESLANDDQQRAVLRNAIRTLREPGS
jgi:hypothetical protein